MLAGPGVLCVAAALPLRVAQGTCRSARDADDSRTFQRRRQPYGRRRTFALSIQSSRISALCKPVS